MCMCSGCIPGGSEGKAYKYVYVWWCIPGGSEGKASARNTGDLGSIPRLGRSPGEGNGNPL